MQNTNIQWTDHTVNFWWGCTKVSRACKHCYAETVAKVFGKRLFGTVPQWGAGKPRFERLEKARAEALSLQKKAAAGHWRIIPHRLDSTKSWEDQIRDGEYGIAEKRAWDDSSPVAMRQGCVPVRYSPKSATAVRARDWDRATFYRPKVFVNSMSDWLDEEVPLEWLAFLLETLAMCPNVDFQLLTKRPENWEKRVNLVSGMYDLQTEAGRKAWGYSAEWYVGRNAPENLWIGCTVEDQLAADTRIPHLLRIPARVRFLSCEPLVGLIDLRKHFWCSTDNNHDGDCMLHPQGCPKPIHWIIAGGESGGPAVPTHPDWLRSLRDQCAAASVPFFFKQWGEWLPVTHLRHATPDTPLNRAYKGHKFDDGTLMLRVGVDTAGALLDGVPHLAFPQ